MVAGTRKEVSGSNRVALRSGSREALGDEPEGICDELVQAAESRDAALGFGEYSKVFTCRVPATSAKTEHCSPHAGQPIGRQALTSSTHLEATMPGGPRNLPGSRE